MERCFYNRMAKSNSQKKVAQQLYQKLDKEAKDHETSKWEEGVLQPATPRRLCSACVILLNDFCLAIHPQ